MPRRERHGGSCCGVSHLHGFHDMTIQTKELIDKAVKDSKYRGHMYEVILTDDQIYICSDTASYLKRSGFKLVSRFFNANSGNYCNVLHLHRNARGNSPWDQVEL